MPLDLPTPNVAPTDQKGWICFLFHAMPFPQFLEFILYELSDSVIPF